MRKLFLIIRNIDKQFNRNIKCFKSFEIIHANVENETTSKTSFSEKEKIRGESRKALRVG
jgi:hypothetical protein